MFDAHLIANWIILKPRLRGCPSGVCSGRCSLLVDNDLACCPLPVAKKYYLDSEIIPGYNVSTGPHQTHPRCVLLFRSYETTLMRVDGT